MNPELREKFGRMLDFAMKAKRAVNGVSKEEFVDDEDRRELVCFRLGHIGEIANTISDEEQNQYPHLFWGQMIGLRHRLFHGYGNINFGMVYDVTQAPLDQLITNLKKLL